jgi:hypothetical protein
MIIDDNMNYSFIFFLVQNIGETTGESKFVGTPEKFLGNKWFTIMRGASTDEYVTEHKIWQYTQGP